MITDPNQQEILLVANTTLTKKQLCERDSSVNTGYLSSLEQLEKACWHGLLYDLIPEIIEEQSSGKKLYLWQIFHGKSFLQIILCEFPTLVEKRFSINPDMFMPVTGNN